MWINLDENQLAALKRIVNHAEVSSPEGHADAAIISERIAWYEAPGANDQAFRDAVKTTDELEMDADAVTSIGDEGAFVMTWSYVTNAEAGIENEDDVGMPLDEVKQLAPGTLVAMQIETRGESADGVERTYPIGTTAMVESATQLPAPQGYAVTLIIGPQDGDKAIVNVFDEADEPGFEFTVLEAAA